MGFRSLSFLNSKFELLLYCLTIQQQHDVLLPEHCSAKVKGEECRLAPSYVISVKSHEGEYMLAVVCDDHKSGLKARLVAMQEANKIPHGSIHFQPVKTVVTDCVIAMNEDYIELDEKRSE
jgi:hypothetical protein